MHTREGRRITADDGSGYRHQLFTGLGHAAAVAGTALIGCLALIALVAILSLCWSVQPGLMVVVGLALGWVGLRVAGRLLSPDHHS
jgi:hypothetical protein